MNEIKVLRASLRVSQSGLARFLGVADMTILRWEKGTEATPSGLPLVVIRVLQDAVAAGRGEAAGELVRHGAGAMAQTLRSLLEFAVREELSLTERRKTP